MDLETLITVVFCLVDDFVRDLCRGRRLRQRGPAPVLADSEVLTVEIVGEFLGLDTDQGLYAYFRRHFAHLFPGLRQVHRTTFLRQAANLWVAKHALWRRLLAMAGHDPAVALIDSMPVPVCRFARAHGAVAEVVESGGGVVSGLSQRARPAFERRRRPRHGAG